MSDRLERLRNLRDQLTTRLEDCSSDHAFAQLAAQLRDVLAQIETCEADEPTKEATALDELRAKRAARKTSGPARSSRTKSR